MKKIAIFLCLLLSFSSVPILRANATEKTIQGYISAAIPISTINGNAVELAVKTADSVQHNFITQTKIRLNDNMIHLLSFENCQELAISIRKNFAEIHVQENRLTAISLSAEPRTIHNAEYNSATGRFSGIDKNMPIFENYGEFLPYTDENHVYDIEVYSYAINITEMRAKNNLQTVKRIYVRNSVDTNFLQSIHLDFETTAQTAICKGTIAVNGTFSQNFSERISDGYGYIAVRNLPNITKQYIISFQLESETGTPLSPTYTYTHLLEATPVLCGYIENAMPVSDINGTYLEILFRDKTRTETIYKINDSVSINGSPCRPWVDESLWRPLIGKCIKASVSNNCIQMVYYETNPRQITDAEYNSVLQHFPGIDNSLPIFYENGAYLPYLDETHTYTLDVYSYAVNITAMTAKNGLETIFHMNLYQSAQDNFLISLGGNFESTIDMAIVKTQLYDKSGNVLQEKESPVDSTYGYISFSDLPNEEKIYSIFFWLEEPVGKRISPLYKCNYIIENIPVYTGYMQTTVIASDINGQSLEFKITNPEDGDLYFRCANQFLLNGISYRLTYDNIEMLKETLDWLTQIECMRNQNGEVNVIRSATMQHSGKDCQISDGVVYKDSFEAEVQFEETYTADSVLVLVALYDENGKMTGWTFETVEVPTDRSDSVSVSVPLDASEQYENGKVFLWETLLSPVRKN